MKFWQDYSRVGESGAQFVALEAALRLYYSGSGFDTRSAFLGYTPEEVKKEFEQRLNELEASMSLVLLTAVEAALRIDFLSRVKFKKRDTVSRAFRELYKQQKMQVRLNEDILEAWKSCHPEFGPLVSQLRFALRYRHWLAHGRYWIPKLDRSYDYASVYYLAKQTMTDLPLMESQ